MQQGSEDGAWKGASADELQRGPVGSVSVCKYECLYWGRGSEKWVAEVTESSMWQEEELELQNVCKERWEKPPR